MRIFKQHINLRYTQAKLFFLSVVESRQTRGQRRGVQWSVVHCVSGSTLDSQRKPAIFFRVNLTSPSAETSHFLRGNQQFPDKLDIFYLRGWGRGERERRENILQSVFVSNISRSHYLWHLSDLFPDGSDGILNMYNILLRKNFKAQLDIAD